MCMAKILPGMKCNPNCTYFPNMECKSWRFDKDNIKRRTDGKEFICGYDGHKIKSWYDECPKERDRVEYEKEKKKEKNK